VSRLFISRDDPGLLDDETSATTLLRFGRIDVEAAKLASLYGVRITCLWHPAPDEIADSGDGEPGKPGLLVRIGPVGDLRDTVQFGTHLGNIQDYTYSVAAPEATRAVIGTQHRRWTELSTKPTYDASGKVTGYTEVETQREGPERYYAYHRNRAYDPDWWGDPDYTPPEMAHTLPWAARGLTAAEVEWGTTAERFIDASHVDWPWMQDPAKPAGYPLDPPSWSRQHQQLAAEIDAFLVDSGPSATIKVSPVETPTTPAIFADYALGDTVRIYLDSENRDEVVREVELVAEAGQGHRANPTLGSDGASSTPYLYRQVKSIWTSVNRIAAREDLAAIEEPVPMPAFAFTRVVEEP
jgi:hypothetical protein